MVDNHYDRYRIEDVQIINIRYFQIKIHGKTYIVDYMDNKDIRQYYPFIMFFPELTNSWKIYDVTGEEKEYHAKSLSWYNKERDITFVYALWIFYLFNIMLFPDFINIAVLTHDNRIKEHWLLVLMILIIGFLCRTIYFYTRKTALELTDKKNYKLEAIEQDTMSQVKRISLVLCLSIFILIFLFIGIGGSSYSQLVMFTILPIYSILFSRFGAFLNTRNLKYKIKENKEYLDDKTKIQ